MSNRVITSMDFKKIGRKLREVRLIQDMYLEVTSSWDLPEIFRVIHRSLDDVLDFKHSMIYLMNADGETLSFQSGWGYPEGYAGVSVKIDHGFIGKAARSGQVMRVGDLRNVFLYMNAVRARVASSALHNKLEEPTQMPGLVNPESLMTVPLITKSGVTGVIVVESQHPNAFDEIDQELMLMVAGHTARLIEEVQQREMNQQQQEELLQVKAHLDRFHALLEVMTSSLPTISSSIHIEEMDMQLQGFSNAEMELEVETGLKRLTKREQEISLLLLKGYTNKEIASTLFLSEIAVKKRLTDIYGKCKVKNRTQLAIHINQIKKQQW